MPYYPGMSRLGTRSLGLLAVAAAMATATPAAAQVYKRTASDGTTYFTNIQPNPTVQRVAYAVPARESQRPASSDYGLYSREIAEASARYGVPERLIWAVIRVESGFDARAVSPKGARGLMQLMPETAAILGVRDMFNPRENIHAGTRHLRGMMDRFHYDLPMAIAAYNAGDRPVAAFRGIPPYPETREYVARVLRYYGAPLAWELQGSGGIQQYVARDGSVTYTNVAPRRLTTVSLQGR
jgi:soluble lytic murein transglycosylase-like protein